jgi:hypothetical protein
VGFFEELSSLEDLSLIVYPITNLPNDIVDPSTSLRELSISEVFHIFLNHTSGF